MVVCPLTKDIKPISKVSGWKMRMKMAFLLETFSRKVACSPCDVIIVRKRFGRIMVENPTF